MFKTGLRLVSNVGLLQCRTQLIALNSSLAKAVVRRLKPSRVTAVPSPIHKL